LKNATTRNKEHQKNDVNNLPSGTRRGIFLARPRNEVEKTSSSKKKKKVKESRRRKWCLMGSSGRSIPKPEKCGEKLGSGIRRPTTRDVIGSVWSKNVARTQTERNHQALKWRKKLRRKEAEDTRSIPLFWWDWGARRQLHRKHYWTQENRVQGGKKRPMETGRGGPAARQNNSLPTTPEGSQTERGTNGVPETVIKDCEKKHSKSWPLTSYRVVPNPRCSDPTQRRLVRQ